MNFAIRYLTEYRYDAPVTDNLNALRVRPATTATQRVDDFGVRVDPEARLHQHLDYFGTEVIEFGIATPHDHLLDRRPRARGRRREPPEPPAGAVGRRSRTAPTRGRRASSCCRAGDEPRRRRARRAASGSRARDTPLATLQRARRADPGPLRVPRRA